MEADYYDQEFSPIKFKGKKKNEVPREIYIELGNTNEIQGQGAKHQKATTIVRFMPIKGSIIKEIND